MPLARSSCLESRLNFLFNMFGVIALKRVPAYAVPCVHGNLAFTEVYRMC